MIRRLALALVSCLACACHEITRFEAPALDDRTRAVLLIAFGSEPAEEVYAVPFEDGMFAWPQVFHRGDVSFAVLAYRCSLERLGLVEGPQALKEAPSERPWLPEPAEVWLAQGGPGRSGTWSSGQMNEAVEQILSKLPLEEENLCRSRQAVLEPKELSMPRDERRDPAFAVRVDDDHILAGTRNGFYYLVDRGGGVQPVEDFGADVYRGAYRADDGELWLMSTTGKLVRGRLGGEFTVVTSTAPLRRRPDQELGQLALDGPKNTPGAPFELYAETDARTFLRFDGTTWTRLADSERHFWIFVARVAWIAPGEAAAISVGSATNTVVRYKNGEVIEERLSGSSVGLSCIAQVPGFGTIAGRDDGSVFIDEGGGSWRPLPGTGEQYFTRTIAPINGGFIYGASLEMNFLEYRFTQYFADLGHCPEERLTDYAATQLVPFADGSLLAATVSDFGDPMGLTLLELAAPAGDCSGD